MGVDTSLLSHMVDSVDHSIGALSWVTQLRYADKRIVNIMKVYIKRNNSLQIELIRYSKKIDFTFAERRIRPPNGECMASIYIYLYYNLP